MKLNPINEIAYKLCEQLEGQKYGTKERLKRENCSNTLWRLVGFLSDDYLFHFLTSVLSDLSNVDDSVERPEDLPRNDNPHWISLQLHDWFEFDCEHYKMVEDIIKEYLKPEEISTFDFDRFIQIAIWQEMDMVYNAVVEYLFEAYNAQDNIDEDDDEDADSDEEA
jgi:hypothetical protein